MCDMRGEDEAMLQPHSQVRHELMHDQYNRLKEEEDHWQDVSVSHLEQLFVGMNPASFQRLVGSGSEALRHQTEASNLS